MENKNNIEKKIPKSNKDLGFDIPDNYFNDLSKNIHHKIISKSDAQPRIISLKRKYLSYAASFIGIIALLSAAYFYILEPRYQLSEIEIIEYLDLYSYDLDESYFVDVIEFNNFENSSTEDTYADEIVDYLLSQNIDDYTILSEY